MKRRKEWRKMGQNRGNGGGVDEGGRERRDRRTCWKEK